jgi:hypothetical protein
MIGNLILAFEALSTGKTIDDAYLLMADLGYDKDKLILVGQRGLHNLAEIAAYPKWSSQPMGKTLIRFRGGPITCPVHVYTGTVRAFVIDRLIRTYQSQGLEKVLESVRTIWGINVILNSNDNVLQNA